MIVRIKVPAHRDANPRNGTIKISINLEVKYKVRKDKHGMVY